MTTLLIIALAINFAIGALVWMLGVSQKQTISLLDIALLPVALVFGVLIMTIRWLVARKFQFKNPFYKEEK